MRAEFKRKEARIDTRECVIRKVIRLPTDEYLAFTRALWLEREFIQENQDLMGVFDGVWHCLLVTGEGMDEGVLVQSEGSSYARYSSFVSSISGLMQQEKLEIEETRLRKPDKEMALQMM